MPNYRAIARRKAAKYGLDPDIFERQINQESGFNPDAVSPAGASGIAQIMPATAQGWGVDPSDPEAALDAAARNMAQYVKKYGGYENALRAYNAGPGAIEASKGYSETNHYVATILGGKDPGGLGKPQGGGGGNGSAAPAAVPQQAKQNPFDTIGSLGGQQEGPYADIMERGWDLLGQIWDKKYGAPATPTTLPSVGGGGGGGGGGKIPAGGKISEGLAEAFYDPVGGYDAGQSIGPIGGHGTHAHFGGQPGAIANVVRRAQKPKWGLTVREYAPVDPVDPVHTEGSWHDKFEGRGGADISGDPERLDDFFKMILRRAGWK